MLKTFRLDNILEKAETKKIPLKKGECSAFKTDEFDIPARTATTQKQGLSCFVPREKCTVLENMISVSANGDYCAFYHDTSFTILQDSYALKGKGYELSELIALYLISAMNRTLSKRYNWNNKSGWEKIRNEVISLPILTSSNIPVIDSEHKYHPEGYIPDWKYMQDYIKELEQDYIRELEQHNVKELEQYLIVTGLNDYELTDEDKEVLDPGNKPFKEFIVEDIIKVEQTKSVIAKSNLVDGDIPYVTRTVSNNGYMSKCGNEDKINKGNCITIGAETGVAFYQPNDFVAGNKVYRLSVNDLGEKHYLFMASALNKLTKDYSYSNARIPEKIKKEHIFLPIQISIDNSPVIDPTHKYHPEGYIPDWEYMERYVRAIEKLVIKDMVEYKNKTIKEMRKVSL